MKLALFGGTFDPVHCGHLAVALAAAEKFDLRVVHFVPATLPPHKGNRVLTDFHHRFAMLALATAEDERFIPSLMEAGASEPNYSIQTVRRLKSTLKKSDKLYFLIGIDAFMEVSTWRQPVQLLSECDFIVVSRPGYSLGDAGEALPEALRPSPGTLEELHKKPADGTIALPSTTIRLLSGVKERISSTEVRAAAAKSLKHLRRYVPEAVARYIKKEHLYASASGQHQNPNAEVRKVLSFRGAHHRES
jgi:nicotinate-nucleotide adenylyltransferase